MAEEMEWQPVRIAPIETGEEADGPLTSREDYARFVGVIVRVRPIAHFDRCQMYKVHPDDYGKLEITNPNEDLLCEHQIQAD